MAVLAAMAGLAEKTLASSSGAETPLARMTRSLPVFQPPNDFLDGVRVGRYDDARSALAVRLLLAGVVEEIVLS